MTMKTDELASRAYVPRVGQPDPFNTEVVGRAKQWQRENLRTGPKPNPNEFTHAVEYRRTNQYGFTVITRHWNQESLDAERRQECS